MNSVLKMFQCSLLLAWGVALGRLRTMVQLVYNAERIKKRFQKRMWVCVSENFDAITTNIDILQQNLSENLMGKRFLLVLDDVWNEDHHKWQRYRASLVSGKKGSKIVATTENVESVTDGLSPYRLQRLSDDSCWSLCSKIVHFLMATLVDILDWSKLERKLLKSSRDCHLQQRQLGAFCTQKVEEEEWKEILRSEIWEDKNSILPALRLSYKHLPAHLKQCFAFCAVFHKDYVFETDNLVQVWIALGFIQPQGSKRLEDKGNTYFDDLLSRYFFQPYKGNYVLHDAIHDLAKCFKYR